MDAHSGMHQIWGVLKAIMLAPPGSLQMFLGQNMKWRVSPPCMQACPDNHCPSMIGSGVATGVLGIVAFGTSVSVCPPPLQILEDLPLLVAYHAWGRKALSNCMGVAVRLNGKDLRTDGETFMCSA